MTKDTLQKENEQLKTNFDFLFGLFNEMHDALDIPADIWQWKVIAVTAQVKQLQAQNGIINNKLGMWMDIADKHQAKNKRYKKALEKIVGMRGVTVVSAIRKATEMAEEALKEGE